MKSQIKNLDKYIFRQNGEKNQHRDIAGYREESVKDSRG